MTEWYELAELALLSNLDMRHWARRLPTQARRLKMLARLQDVQPAVDESFILHPLKVMKIRTGPGSEQEVWELLQALETVGALDTTSVYAFREVRLRIPADAAKDSRVCDGCGCRRPLAMFPPTDTLRVWLHIRRFSQSPYIYCVFCFEDDPRFDADAEAPADRCSGCDAVLDGEECWINGRAVCAECFVATHDDSFLRETLRGCSNSIDLAPFVDGLVDKGLPRGNGEIWEPAPGLK